MFHQVGKRKLFRYIFIDCIVSILDNICSGPPQDQVEPRYAKQKFLSSTSSTLLNLLPVVLWAHIDVPAEDRGPPAAPPQV